MKFEDLKPGQHFIVATKGMRGHFACEMWMNNKDIPDTVFPEPWQSDNCTFDTKEEAIAHAKLLAEEMNLPYID